jgi:homocysteine S-methyltransferase
VTRQKSIVLLDGGMGQELIKRSKHAVTPLWSTTVLRDEPALVTAVHADYIKANARVITLNNYSATPIRLGANGLANEFESLHLAAIKAARLSIAQTQPQHPVRVAGCLPPLVSSYHASDVPSEDACLTDYRALVAAQISGVDLFLCETLTTVREVETATTAGVESGKPVWVGMTVDDQDGTRLRSGESLANAVAAAKACGAAAVLINCSWPEAITQGLPVLAASGLPFGGYANGFTNAASLVAGSTVAGLAVRRDLDPEAYAKHAMGWVAMGARIVGGCCEVGPAHISHLSECLDQAGYAITAAL